MGTFFVILLARLIAGGVIGLAPYLLGRYLGKTEMGTLGLILCALSSMLHISLPLLVAIIFVILLFLRRDDIHIRAQSASYSQPVWSPNVQTGARRLELVCLSGPLQGRCYPVSQRALTIGRETDCGVRLPENTPMVSRHHCQIRWQNGQAVLTDLGSSYGTFLSDGRQLMPNNPVVLYSGARFLLGPGGCQFQIVER